MKIGSLATAVVLVLANAAAAQDGAYYGIGLGSSLASSEPYAIKKNNDVSAKDYSLALTAGYRFPTAGALGFGVEGNLDLLTGNLMDFGGSEACPGFGPTWCEVTASARLRGTISHDIGGGRLIGSLGVVVVRGRLENGPDVYQSGTGTGVSVGVSWENLGAGLPVRADLNYDKISDDNAPRYDRTLDMVGFRVSYMF